MAPKLQICCGIIFFLQMRVRGQDANVVVRKRREVLPYSRVETVFNVLVRTAKRGEFALRLE